MLAARRTVRGPALRGKREYWFNNVGFQRGELAMLNSPKPVSTGKHFLQHVRRITCRVPSNLTLSPE